MSRLMLDGITKRFGGVVAVDNVTAEIGADPVTAIIGPNGAGKTTLFNLIFGILMPDDGSVHVDDVDATRLRPYQMAELGLARTFQNLELFAGMTVADHLRVGRHRWGRAGVLDAVLRLPRHRREEADTTIFVEILQDRLGLTTHRSRPADSLPYGLQRRVELGRALASDPSMILLDEPLAGLNRVESRVVSGIIREVADSGMVVVLVEHDMHEVMRISDRVLVLDQGGLIADGSPAAVRSEQQVVDAYLGVEDEE
ncbi:MAG: ATP-binding cassette domain-containing protein [Acidimicrobiia bacterium]|nr:ATP-binding cassette domain-containing protein [Acidimicrobiia bacterium]